jgi:hypothetical protein
LGIFKTNLGARFEKWTFFQTKDDTWGETILEVRGKNPTNLPIRDIAVYDVGDDGEEFGLELGQVCFSP